jgi:hypothetical protein
MSDTEEDINKDIPIEKMFQKVDRSELDPEELADLEYMDIKDDWRKK